ncbi:helix-turn-helix domain-containing protein [Haematobacter genomosp. 1]|uniref:HTH merR-type domain-containing protein n=1 Tax=Haematobacter genomosp. 1 TaxID=366618 RepID=A0A212AA21_9RHOB|nr:helix-turn-helix domain-containing protein [Haematobacter genomosp. 1]OWJ76986.1 hypothetical protein CDV49_12575 [Haematobacter genomosp. 1]
MPELFSRTFTVTEVAEALGVDSKDVQNYAARGLIVGHKGEAPAGKGRARAFTFFNVMEIAVAISLKNFLTIPPMNAFMIAGRFAHGGQGLPIERKPALPFHHRHGRTILVFTADQDGEIIWRPGADIFAEARHALNGALSFGTVDVSTLFERVVTRLGFDPRAVLDAAYPGSWADHAAYQEGPLPVSFRPDDVFCDR